MDENTRRGGPASVPGMAAGGSPGGPPASGPVAERMQALLGDLLLDGA